MWNLCWPWPWWQCRLEHVSVGVPHSISLSCGATRACAHSLSPVSNRQLGVCKLHWCVCSTGDNRRDWLTWEPLHRTGLRLTLLIRITHAHMSGFTKFQQSSVNCACQVECHLLCCVRSKVGEKRESLKRWLTINLIDKLIAHCTVPLSILSSLSHSAPLFSKFNFKLL